MAPILMAKAHVLTSDMCDAIALMAAFIAVRRNLRKSSGHGRHAASIKAVNARIPAIEHIDTLVRPAPRGAVSGHMRAPCYKSVKKKISWITVLRKLYELCLSPAE